MSSDELVEWEFRFGLCGSKEGQLIPREKCDELLDVIVSWAEANSLGIGGGYRPFEPDEPDKIPTPQPGPCPN